MHNCMHVLRKGESRMVKNMTERESRPSPPTPMMLPLFSTANLISLKKYCILGNVL